MESRPDGKAGIIFEPLEKSLEWWIKTIGRHIEENKFYELVEEYLEGSCDRLEILLDENPGYNVYGVDGTDHVWFGRAHYVNEIVCDNTVYRLDIEYTVYEFEMWDNGDTIRVIHNIERVNVEKTGEMAGGQA
ncbi:MAG: hypothetical protein JHC26_11530 [Thermofilum sp.]|uniref:hypothetical protein n=1 Tax=Thermofilum sp. TaxID=1961369 RepID=UPI00258AD884|nr:hypothetical protein [Thermofilum sp.]MCI4409713.1 hypothetical protein [Thermofilum sp.]